MTTTLTVSVAQAAHWTVRLSRPLLSRSRHSPAGVGLSHPRMGHGRWPLALLWLLWLGWSTNAIAQTTTGITVAGGHEKGKGANQLSSPQGVFVDPLGAVYVADSFNDRIQKWAPEATSGTTVAGGKGTGSGDSQLQSPSAVFVDRAGFIYVADTYNDRIQKWFKYSTGTTVAGGKGKGSGANQLDNPFGVAVDQAGAVYVADENNHRIQKWSPGATTGIPFAEGHGGKGNGPNQLSSPTGLFVDRAGAIYVADNGNHRIQKFSLVQLGSGGLLGGSAPALQLVAPLYNCQSGAFTFQTSGGGGLPIEYMAPGITGWTSQSNQFVDKETRTAADVQPITLVARQNGKIVRYIWAIRAICLDGPASARVGFELSFLQRDWLNRHIATKDELIREVTAWQDRRKQKQAKANWQFTAINARIKLYKLYSTT